jgi:hypothetical protein
VLGEEARRRPSGHGFSTEGREERGMSRSEFGDLRKQIKGVPRGKALLVAGRSPRRRGRERSDRWKGESEAFSLQKVDAGNERANESQPQALPGVNHDRTRLYHRNEDAFKAAQKLDKRGFCSYLRECVKTFLQRSSRTEKGNV